MHPDLQYLENLFSRVRYSGLKHTDCIIKESDPGAKTQTIYLQGKASFRDWFLLYSDDDRVACPAHVLNKTLWDATVCKWKKVKLTSPLLSAKPGCFHHKACDAILVSLAGGRLRIVYIELKSNTLRDASEQLKSMSYFMQYAVNIFNDGRPNVYAIDEHFVCFKCVNGKNSRRCFSSLSQNVKEPTQIGAMNTEHFPMAWFL